MRVQLGTPDVILTTEDAASKHGAPILLLRGISLGPADIVTMKGASRSCRGAQIVKDWAEKPTRTLAEVALARRYLWQWSEGPQLPRPSD